MSLSFPVARAPHAEPFEPVERLDRICSKAGTREARAPPSMPRRKFARTCLPFSPQRDASVAALIGQRAGSASKIDAERDAGRYSGPRKDSSLSVGKSYSLPVSVQDGEHISTIFGANCSGVRRVEGSSPGIAAARMRVRSGPGLTSITRISDVLTVSAA